MSINSRIAELILRTQNASDGGKDIIAVTNNSRGRRDNAAGYEVKDKFIKLAIDMIARNNTNWKYAVRYCGDYKKPCWIVYFQTKINDEKVQISFHTFNETFRRFTGRSFRIPWDGGDSRKSAIRAYKYYCPNGDYAE